MFVSSIIFFKLNNIYKTKTGKGTCFFDPQIVVYFKYLLLSHI